VLAPGSVERVQGGYKVNTGWWTGYDPFFVAWDRALPFSPDGHYHICINYEEDGVIPQSQMLHCAAECGMIAKGFPQ
jgi:hypothetical protein